MRRVSRQVLAYGTADVSVLAVNLLLPVYTRVLSPAEYGVAALLLVFEAFLKPVLRCGLDGAYLRHDFDEKTDSGRASLAWTVLASRRSPTAPCCPAVAGRRVDDAAAARHRQSTSLATAWRQHGPGERLFLPLGLLRAREQSALVGREFRAFVATTSSA